MEIGGTMVELEENIERVRLMLHRMLEEGANKSEIYQVSLKLDKLLEELIEYEVYK